MDKNGDGKISLEEYIGIKSLMFDDICGPEMH